jgi:hypothetical protein
MPIRNLNNQRFGCALSVEVGESLSRKRRLTANDAVFAGIETGGSAERLEFLSAVRLRLQVSRGSLRR